MIDLIMQSVNRVMTNCKSLIFFLPQLLQALRSSKLAED